MKNRHIKGMLNFTSVDGLKLSDFIQFDNLMMNR
jgi:hypothetical protein